MKHKFKNGTEFVGLAACVPRVKLALFLLNAAKELLSEPFAKQKDICYIVIDVNEAGEPMMSVDGNGGCLNTIKLSDIEEAA